MSNIKEWKELTVIKLEMPGGLIETKYGSKNVTKIELVTVDAPWSKVMAAFNNKDRGIALSGHKRCVSKRYVVDFWELEPTVDGNDIEFRIHSQPIKIQKDLWGLIQDRQRKNLKTNGVDHLERIAKDRGFIK